MNFLLFRIIFCLNSFSFYISGGVLICIIFCWHTKYCFSLPRSAHAAVSGRLLQIHKVNFLSSVSIFFLFKNVCSHRMSFSEMTKCILVSVYDIAIVTLSLLPSPSPPAFPCLLSFLVFHFFLCKWFFSGVFLDYYFWIVYH